MSFDPMKRENLSPQLRNSIAQVMQFALLDEIFGAGTWTPKDIVFHGGTSIHVVWKSPRWSEDLDFMIAQHKVQEISRVMKRAAEGVAQRMAMSLPGSEIRLKAPTQERLGAAVDAAQLVLGYDVVWSHPNKMGTVKVKAEFLPVMEEHLAQYAKDSRYQGGADSKGPDLEKSSMMIHTRPEFSDFALEDLMVRSLIPVGTPESLYGDKVAALAMRPYLKPRDFFDLWWLATQLDAQPKGQKLYEVVRRNSDAYEGRSDQALLDGVERFLTYADDTIAKIETNLRVFLPDRVFEQLRASGAFQQMYYHAMSEVARLKLELVERVGPVIEMPKVPG